MRNPYLEKLLGTKGRNDEDTWTSIMTDKGSVQHLDCLDDHEKAVFKTAFEIDQRWLIEHAADRTPYICQSQSLNIFLPADVHKRDLHQIHMMAWKRGVKTLYYCRSLSIQRADVVSNDAVVSPLGDQALSAPRLDAPAMPLPVGSPAGGANNDYEECLSCQYGSSPAPRSTASLAHSHAPSSAKDGRSPSRPHPSRRDLLAPQMRLTCVGPTMSLLDAKPIYKPFHYPWAYDAWLMQQRLHWLPEEVPLADDVKDWRNKLTDSERHLLTQIFRFFTQADVEVNNCYMRHYSRVFKPTEVQMMLAAFSSMETVHVAAYSHLLDTIGMPETEYSVFLTVKEMKDKYDYMQEFNVDSKADIAKTLAVFGAFTEGLQLFASFAMLMNFPRFNKMKGMGQIVTWSVRDETLHCNSIIKLFRTFVQENPEIWTEALQREIYLACSTIVDHEDAFIDLAFQIDGIEGMTAIDVKRYIRFIADRRLIQLGLQPIYKKDAKNPLPWMDQMLNAIEHTNFFENRATEYSKASTKGTWEEAFG